MVENGFLSHISNKKTLPECFFPICEYNPKIYSQSCFFMTPCSVSRLSESAL